MNNPSNINHIAIVMDGNGRWAKNKSLSRSKGHEAGKDTLKIIVGQCLKHQIKYLSVFAFSSENWKRPQSEVSTLMDLFLSALNRETADLSKNGVQLNIIGDKEKFSMPLRKMIKMAENNTAKNNKLILNVGVNYGGRWDILTAAKSLAKNNLDFTEDNLTNALAFKTPEPDLLIRSGGEKRISNFMLWQIAYSEIYFTDTLWPDFTESEFVEALKWYAKRERRFGKISEQIESVL